MRRLKHDHPEYAWAAVAATILVADITGNTTMSEAFRMISRHPVAGPAIAVGWGILTAHLFGVIDPRFDPFHKAGCPKLRCPHAR